VFILLLPSITNTHVTKIQALDQNPPPTPQPNQNIPIQPSLIEKKESLEHITNPDSSLLDPPINDDFDKAIAIDSTPFLDFQNTVEATFSDDDLNLCGLGINSNSVWYHFTAPKQGSLLIDTFGSDYDTVLSAFTGSRDSLTPIICNDDSISLQSQIQFNVEAGESYYIEVADWGEPGGGQLKLSVDFIEETVPIIDVPLDIILLQDETGSMADDIGNLSVLSPAIWDSISGMAESGFRMSVVGFRDFDFYPWGYSGDWVYRKLQDFTTVRDEFVASVNTLTAGGGYDTPESQYPAIYYMLTPDHPCIDSNLDGDCVDTNDTPIDQQPEFRSGAKLVVLLATDASFHDPEDTSGYPGPSRNQVLQALISHNATVIGLVPGGAGVIPEVDDLAIETGGSVEDTGSSGQQVAEAIANAIGTFGSTPGVDGVVLLSISPLQDNLHAIVPVVRVENPTSADHTYSVVTILYADGNPVSTINRDITVAARTSALVSEVNFGIQPAGSYQVKAELWLGGNIIGSSGTLDLEVSQSSNQIAIIEGAKLGNAAEAEIQEMIDIVASRAGESLSDFTLELLSQITRLFATDVLKNIGETAHLPVLKTEKAALILFKRLEAFQQWWQDRVHTPIETSARRSMDDYLQPVRIGINQRQALFNEFVSEKDAFVWTEGMGGIVSRYELSIRNRTEWEIIPGYNGIPPVYVGPTTLWWENANFTFLKFLLDALGWILLIAAVVLVILLIIKGTILTLGAVVPLLLKSGIALISFLITKVGILKFSGAGFLVILVLVMGLQVENYLGPAVQEMHDEGLTLLTNEIAVASGTAFLDISTKAEKDEKQINFSTMVINRGPENVTPIIENTLFSTDGSVIDINLDRPKILNGEQTEVNGRFLQSLPPGKYQMVSTVHINDQIGLTTDAVGFTVTEPTVELNVSLASPHLQIGEPLEASIEVINTNTMTATGSLELLAFSSDQQHMDGWSVDLGPGEDQTFDFSFVPQSVGGQYLRVLVSQSLWPVLMEDIPYSVGDSASVVINYDNAPYYSPGENINILLNATNGGTLASSSTINIQTVDLSQPESTLSDQTLTLDLAPGESKDSTINVLPASQATPGTFATRIYLNGELYRSSEFSIEAIDTLFAEIYPHQFTYNFGDTVNLDIYIRNSEYAYTDADVNPVISQPDGSQFPLTVSKLSTGHYYGSFTASMVGTHLASVEVYLPNYRGIGNRTFFVVDTVSQLVPQIDGRPILGTSKPITITLSNELAIPMPDANVVISGTNEHLYSLTDELGQVIVYLSPENLDSYQLSVQKLGFATTLVDIPIWVTPDIYPPTLYMTVPLLTNQTPVTVIGSTDPDALLHINEIPVSIDAIGQFTTTIPLNEGDNEIRAVASDSLNNTSVLTYPITLDTDAPMLSLNTPVEESVLSGTNTFEVKGETEAGAIVTINNSIASTDNNNVFRKWVPLSIGSNILTITANDPAGNTTHQVREIVYEVPITGLNASNDSPTAFGLETTLTASVTDGTNVTYTWDLGDDTTKIGATVTHKYNAPGIYTATVTASNLINQAQATTNIIINTGKFEIHLPIIEKP
jgi:hypothetical protein